MCVYPDIVFHTMSCITMSDVYHDVEMLLMVLQLALVMVLQQVKENHCLISGTEHALT